MIEKLNILMNYPVHWNSYKILRDFMQNFYDSKERQLWWEDFSYTYEDATLTMRMAHSRFSYEWLLHIGASSKTNKKNAAGYFGEGFKIAALCALRDYNWDIYMSSDCWHLHVIETDIIIDGNLGNRH